MSEYIKKYEKIKKHIETKWNIDLNKKDFRYVIKLIRQYINDGNSDETILYLIADFLRRSRKDVLGQMDKSKEKNEIRNNSNNNIDI